MRYDNLKKQASENVEVAPTACPACRSAQVTTSSTTVSAESYWRCLKCGEVWNVGRRESGRRSARYDGFRR